MVRRATEADIPLIVALGREAHEASAYRGVIDFDPDSFAKTCRTMMVQANALVLVCDRGSIWMARFPCHFNHAVMLRNEVFFYATKGGDALRRAAERWSDGPITLSRNAATSDRLDKLYLRAGYRLIETTFLRRA